MLSLFLGTTIIFNKRWPSRCGFLAGFGRSTAKYSLLGAFRVSCSRLGLRRKTLGRLLLESFFGFSPKRPRWRNSPWRTWSLLVAPCRRRWTRSCRTSGARRHSAARGWPGTARGWSAHLGSWPLLRSRLGRSAHLGSRPLFRPRLGRPAHLRSRPLFRSGLGRSAHLGSRPLFRPRLAWMSLRRTNPWSYPGFSISGSSLGLRSRSAFFPAWHGPLYTFICWRWCRRHAASGFSGFQARCGWRLRGSSLTHRRRSRLFRWRRTFFM